MPDTTVKPSGGAVGLIQRNTDEGKYLLENSSEMLTKADVLMLLYPAAQVLWLGNHVVVFSTCGLQTCMLFYEGEPLGILNVAVVAVSSCVLLLCLWLGSCYIC